MLHIRFNYLLMLTLAFGPISAQRLNAAAELSDTTETAILTIEEATEIITCSSAGTSSAESVALTDSVPPEDISVLTPVIPRYQMRQPQPDFKSRPSIYAFPYSKNRSLPQWHRMWVNTAVLGSAFVSTLLVLECLPEDATTWNRAAIQEVPPFTRWYKMYSNGVPNGITTILYSIMCFILMPEPHISCRRAHAVLISGSQCSTVSVYHHSAGNSV